MITFLEYIDKTDDSVNKKLTLLRKALEKKGYRVKDFINNDEDERYLNSDEGQEELAVSITQAVKRYKNIVENGNKVNDQIVK